MKHMNSWQITDQFILKTLLAKDYKGWGWFLWPTSRWTTTMVAEVLASHGYCEIHKRYKTGEVYEIWLKREITPAEVEQLCLGEKRMKIKRDVERGLR